MDKSKALSLIRNEIDVKKAVKFLVKNHLDNKEVQVVLAVESFRGNYNMQRKKAVKVLIENLPDQKSIKDRSLGFEILGRSYLYGEGTRKNFKKSFNYVSLAANYGREWSMHCLADFYFEGIGIRKSYQQAVCWYNKATLKEDDSNSYLRLGYLYFHGLGISKNISKAESMYRKSYGMGNLDAGYNLVLMNKNSKKGEVKNIINSLISKRYKYSLKLRRIKDDLNK